MPGPFPGMDPYLERRDLWQGFHNTFIAYLNAAINQALPDNYVALVDTRLFVTSVPPHTIRLDVALFQTARNSPTPASV